MKQKDQFESLQKNLFQEVPAEKTTKEAPREVPPETPVLEPKLPDVPALPMTPLQVRASEQADPPMSKERVQRLKNEVGTALQGTKAMGKATAKAKSRTKTNKQNKDETAEKEDENPLEGEESLSEDEQGSQEGGEKNAEKKACVRCFCSDLELIVENNSSVWKPNISRIFGLCLCVTVLLTSFVTTKLKNIFKDSSDLNFHDLNWQVKPPKPMDAKKAKREEKIDKTIIVEEKTDVKMNVDEKGVITEGKGSITGRNENQSKEDKTKKEKIKDDGKDKTKAEEKINKEKIKADGKDKTKAEEKINKEKIKADGKDKTKPEEKINKEKIKAQGKDKTKAEEKTNQEKIKADGKDKTKAEEKINKEKIKADGKDKTKAEEKTNQEKAEAEEKARASATPSGTPQDASDRRRQGIKSLVASDVAAPKAIPRKRKGANVEATPEVKVGGETEVNPDDANPKGTKRHRKAAPGSRKRKVQDAEKEDKEDAKNEDKDDKEDATKEDKEDAKNEGKEDKEDNEKKDEKKAGFFPYCNSWRLTVGVLASK